MINDILEEIKKAESEAEKLIGEALESGKSIVFDASVEAEKIRIGAVESVKEERKNVLKTAEKDGTAEYDQIFKAGQREAERIKKAAKTAQATEFIKEKIFSVNR